MHNKIETTSLLPISLDIDCSQKTDIIWSKGNIFSFDLRYSTLLYVIYDQRYDYKTEKFWQDLTIKELQIWHFLKNQIFRFLIISLIIFDIQECTIPQTKAKDILFWPYFVRFLATINTLWDRRQWSCLVFFDSDFMTSQSYIYLLKVELLNLTCHFSIPH